MFFVARLALALSIIFLPYWPGGDTSPEYPDRIAVINTIGYMPHLGDAVRAWNRCDARVRLYLAPGSLPKQPGTITIVNEEWEGIAKPWGGWMGEYGLVSIGPLAWMRTTHVLAHEVGHALGFGHTPRDNSVMSDAPTVTNLDCKGLRAYYGT